MVCVLVTAPSLLQSRDSDGIFGFWLGFVGLLVLHLPLRQYPRDYYFVTAALPGVLGLAWFFVRLQHGGILMALISQDKKNRVLWFSLIVVSLVDPFPPLIRYPWQAEMRLAGETLPLLLEKDESVASLKARGAQEQLALEDLVLRTVQDAETKAR